MRGQEGDEPRRNAGGNPYVPKGDGREAVESYLAAMPDWKQGVGRQIDALVEQHVPGVDKAVRWNTPFYGMEGDGWFLCFYCYKRYVQVTFLKGGRMDPPPPKASKYPDVRYLDIHEADQDWEESLVGWINQAATLPGERVF